MKERILKKINPDFIAIFIFAILIGSINFYIKFEINDELWNFSNVYKMCNGYQIYKDLNVIITPLFFYLGELFLKVFGTNYFSFKIYNFFIYLLLYTAVYSIFKNLNKRRIKAFIYTIIVFLFSFIDIRAGANYNTLAIAIVLIGILVNLKIDKDKWHLPYLQGIITFAIFMTKQNIAVFYFMGIFISDLFICKSKKCIIKIIKFYLKQVLTIILLGIIFLYALKLQGNLYDFINFCVLGIDEFASNNVLFKGDVISIICINFISIILSIIFINNKMIENKIKYSNIKMLPIAVLLILMSYPIFNIYHVTLGSVVCIILLLSNIDYIIIEKVLDNKIENVIKIYKIIACIIFFAGIIIFITYNILYVQKSKNPFQIYKGSIMTEEQIEKINKICKYIKSNEENGKSVKIISCRANLYMNVLNKNNGVLDLPFYGNFGNKGENIVIDYIKDAENAKILIQKDDKIPWQESYKIRNYIKENLNYEGEIEDFLIYSK